MNEPHVLKEKITEGKGGIWGLLYIVSKKMVHKKEHLPLGGIGGN